MKKGFTLIEILIASVILTLGLLSVLALFTQSQRMMLASARFETAQRVLNYFEMVHPMPPASEVTDDPLRNDLLNVDEERAGDLAAELEIDLTPQDARDLRGYTAQREVDDIDDEELARNGGIYTVRTTVKWGGDNFGGKKDEMTVVRLWWKGAAAK
ncbi:MAG: prepilin-type N-terminal cleavage/methylation domain-containing protein [Kiritimatiellia bacterium]